MDDILRENLSKMNTTGISWEDMTEEQKEKQRREWDAIAGDRKNLYCSCPRAHCENNHNCQFCIATHRYYGSLPDCLRLVEDNISEGVPLEKRHNIHKNMNPHQTKAISRADYGAIFANSDKITDPVRLEQARKNAKEWHDLVRVPENVKCPCKREDCRFHSNCTKCIALHRYYNTFPKCCEQIYDNIANAILAYRAEQAEA